jgi:hypothetical protein
MVDRTRAAVEEGTTTAEDVVGEVVVDANGVAVVVLLLDSEDQCRREMVEEEGSLELDLACDKCTKCGS